MAEEVNEESKEREESLEEAEEQEEPESAKGGMSALLSPEGFAMLALAGTLDLISAIFALIGTIDAGVGLILAKIVYVLGLVLIGGWIFLRSGSAPSIGKGKLGKKELTEMAKNQLVEFLKKNSKKLAGKAIPMVGDIIPFWTITVYSELTSKK